MIKAIIFDFGNVLCSFTNEVFLQKISKLSGKSRDELFDLIYNKSGVTKKYELGLFTSQKFFEELSSLCGLHVTLKELKEIYSKDKFTRIVGMGELASQLTKKYKVALLSNTSEWDFEYMKKVAPEIETFNVITTSYQVAAIKPQAKIYQETVRKLNLSPGDCIYTDDILEYVDVAKSLGMYGIHFKGNADFKNSLKNLGVVGLE